MIKQKITQKDMIYHAKILYSGKIVVLKLALDTGNFLNDPITRLPVIIVESEKLKELIPSSLLNQIENDNYYRALEQMEGHLKRRCSIIPFSSIGKNNGILLGFRPDDFILQTQEGEEISKKVIIAIYPYNLSQSNSYAGLIGLNILNKEEKSNEYCSTIKN